METEVVDAVVVEDEDGSVVDPALIEGNSSAIISAFRYDGQTADLYFTLTTDSGVSLALKIEKVSVAPHPELVEAMDLLAEDLASECEVESSVSADGYVNNRVIFTKFTAREKKGRIGYKLIGKRVLEGSRTPMSIVSALKWDEHSDVKQRLDDVTIERLDSLKGEVNKFLKNLVKPVVTQTLFGEESAPQVQIKQGKPADETPF